MTNIARAREVVSRVESAGVREFVVCGGSRNAPLIAAVAHGKTYTFVDERSAAFFALGRIKRDGVPVAIITTSGTAVAELLPATVEAFYSGAPLILITADRPERFRGTGAPQTIDQIGIFGGYAATDIATWNREMPLHINIEFDEPLIDE
jgi:2-succinyl-5-enolpyruvyl-6-hydroxy-3-cyclohexene-1-carboxylate synthase